VLSCWLLIYRRSQQIIRESFEVLFVVDNHTVLVIGLISAFLMIRKGRKGTYKHNLVVLNASPSLNLIAEPKVIKHFAENKRTKFFLLCVYLLGTGIAQLVTEIRL
jgi:hypothetical protein